MCSQNLMLTSGFVLLGNKSEANMMNRYTVIIQRTAFVSSDITFSSLLLSFFLSLLLFLLFGGLLDEGADDDFDLLLLFCCESLFFSYFPLSTVAEWNCLRVAPFTPKDLSKSRRTALYSARSNFFYISEK